MEPPSKRLRLDPSRYPDDDDDEENQDELSMTPAQFDAIQDPMYQLDKSRAKAATRLKSTFEDIFAKYGKDFGDDDGDVINFYTDEIEVDNGHLKSLENRKDGTTEDSVSSDEEGRASNGKSASRGEKSRPKFKPPIPANRSRLSQTPQIQSPWNNPPGLGLYRLPSLSASSSPYGGYPPFDFGRSAHGNAHIDPAWQTPDLPIPLPHHQHSQFTGVGRNTFVSFGGQPHGVVRRLASAKSFLQRTASTSSGVHDDDTEDDDIDGRSTQEGRHTPSESHKKVLVPSERHEPVDESTRYPQTGASRQKTSPVRTKKGRPRKLNACKPARAPNDQAQNEPRQLAPNERRIEIIFPMMKHLFLTEREQATVMPAPVTDGSPDETGIEQMTATDESIETTPVPQSIESHEDVVSDQSSTDLAASSEYENVKHTAQLSLDLMHACGSPEPQDSQSRQMKEPIELTSTSTWPSDEQCLEHACVDASQDLEHSQSVASSATVDTFTVNVQRIEQESHRNSQSDATPSSEQLSIISNTGVDEEQTARDPDLKEVVEAMLVDQRDPDEVPLQSLSPTQSLRKHSADATTETPVSAPTEDIITATAISPEPESWHCSTEDVPPDEQCSSPAKSFEEDTLPALLHTVNTTTAPRRTIELEDVFVDSEIPHSHEPRISSPERGVGSRSPELPSAIHSSPEPELHADPDHPTPVPEASQTREDQEFAASNQPSLSNVLADEIDGLQLGSDNWDAPRSPSLGTQELPDEDLSALPTRPDVHSTSELVLRISKYKTRSAVQNNAGTGRSPSPELGTPAGPEIVRGTASGTTKAPVTPTTPTRKRGPRNAKPASSRKRSPSSKRFPLSSLLPDNIDDESEDELSLADPFSGATSRFNSPFSRASANASPRLPPLLSTPRKRNRKNGLLVGSPPSTRTPNRVHGRNVPPATDSRAGRSQTRRRQSRAVNSSPLARRVAERLLSSPTKRHRATPTMSPSLVASPNGTLRRCGEDGFVCERAFCLTCCI